jgi:hypothetical protein
MCPNCGGSELIFKVNTSAIKNYVLILASYFRIHGRRRKESVH